MINVPDCPDVQVRLRTVCETSDLPRVDNTSQCTFRRLEHHRNGLAEQTTATKEEGVHTCDEWDVIRGEPAGVDSDSGGIQISSRSINFSKEFCGMNDEE